MNEIEQIINTTQEPDMITKIHPEYTYICKAEYGDKEPYSIFKETFLATSFLHAFGEFQSRFFKAFEQGEKDNPDRIVITNQCRRIRMVISEGAEDTGTPNMWDTL